MSVEATTATKRFPPPPWPVLEVGLASAALGVVAAVLLLLPVLSIPLSAAGVMCGIAGTVLAGKGYPISLRSAVGGTALCCMVLGAGLLIYFASFAELPSRSVQRLWQAPSERPFVPPPAGPVRPDGT